MHRVMGKIIFVKIREEIIREISFKLGFETNRSLSEEWKKTSALILECAKTDFFFHFMYSISLK